MKPSERIHPCLSISAKVSLLKFCLVAAMAGIIGYAILQYISKSFVEQAPSDEAYEAPELVRDTQKQDGAVRAPDAELQQQADVEYFPAAINLRAGSVYLSNVSFQHGLPVNRGCHVG